MPDYVRPKLNMDVFNCPNCDSYSDQIWDSVQKREHSYGDIVHQENFRIANCRHCDEISIWNNDKMIYPSRGNAPLPNSDMPEEIKNDYVEASDIAARSPRAACLLLRLCIEKICNDKIENSNNKDLNEKIGILVEQGLPKEIQKALDAVRVIGSQAGHPLEMNLVDDSETAISLFKLVNFISDWGYTRSKEIDKIYDSLPDSKKNAINKRDN